MKRNVHDDDELRKVAAIGGTGEGREIAPGAPYPPVPNGRMTDWADEGSGLRGSPAGAGWMPASVVCAGCLPDSRVQGRPGWRRQGVGLKVMR